MTRINIVVEIEGDEVDAAADEFVRDLRGAITRNPRILDSCVFVEIEDVPATMAGVTP